MAVDIEREDAIYLKRELLLRMGVQNGVIVLNAILFLATADLQFLLAHHPAHIALGFGLFAAILASIWCHHGARQAQIKQYLLLLQSRHATDEGWEGWLPRHGLTGLLGSRWFLSTKATFIGSILALGGNGLYLDHSAEGIRVTVLTMLVLAGVTLLLLGNPKEQLEAAVP
jgi:hypothetical protein